MKKDSINELFKNLENQFDVEVPNSGHQERFLSKLKQTDTIVLHETKKRFNWKPFLAIAASVVLLLSVFIGTREEEPSYELASVSPEMEQTQNFFNSVITEELEKLQVFDSPIAKSVIEDAMERITELEKEYKALKNDLRTSGNDKRVVYAMIQNFQSRIDILQTVFNQMEDIHQYQKNI